MFKLSELTDNQPAPPQGAAMAHPFLLTHTQRIKAVRDLMESLPDVGEAFMLFSVGQFNKFSLILWVLGQIDRIDRLTISTYSMTNAMLESLSNLMQSGKVGSVNVIISDSIRYRLPKVAQSLDSMHSAMPDRFMLKYCWNHSKVCLVNTGQLYLTIEGSGNFSDNAALEQYIIINSKQAYEFRIDALLRAPTKQ